MRIVVLPLLLGLGLAACEPSPETAHDERPVGNELPRGHGEAGIGQAIAPGGRADDAKPVEKSPVDPRSAEGAAQALQSYAALLEQGRHSDAQRLWMEDGAASIDASKYSRILAEIGAPGPLEGAAGSIYAEFPVRFYGELKNGNPFSSTGTATLRRVNDVPGSTAKQRRWHIYRFDVQPPL